MKKNLVILFTLLVSLALTLPAVAAIVKPPPIREIKPRIGVVNPAPGQTRWHACVGRTATISWDYLGNIGGTVNVILKGSSGATITVTGVPAGADWHGSYVWNIPENVSDGGKGEGGMFEVRIQAGNGSVTAVGGRIEVLDPKQGPCPDK